MDEIIDQLTIEVKGLRGTLASNPILQVVCDDIETNKGNLSYYKSICNVAKELNVEVVVDRYKKFDLPTLYLTGSRDTHEYDVEDYSTARAVLYIMKRIHGLNDGLVVIAGRNRFGKEIRDAIERTTNYSTCMVNSTFTESRHHKQTLIDAADIVISATGNPNTFDDVCFGPSDLLIDVGRGDFGTRNHHVAFQTPALNGVGKITVLMLLKRVIEYYAH